jgi:glutamate/tyrosine decarboxylase-like PLP-dependent enzyme
MESSSIFKPGYLISEQAHYSVGRNVKIMGLGDASIVKVPVDKHFRMRTDLLEEIKSAAEKKRHKDYISSCQFLLQRQQDLMMIWKP